MEITPTSWKSHHIKVKNFNLGSSGCHTTYFKKSNYFENYFTRCYYWTCIKINHKIMDKNLFKVDTGGFSHQQNSQKIKKP